MGQTKRAKITFTCEPELKEYLTKMADSESRTLSNFVELLVQRAIETQTQQSPKPTKGKGDKEKS